MFGWREVENQSLKASIETIEAAKRRLLAVVFCAGRKELVMAIMRRMGRGVKMVTIDDNGVDVEFGCLFSSGTIGKPNCPPQYSCKSWSEQ